MRRWIALGAAALLAGCAHQVALTPADGVGPIGRGQAPWKLNGNSGALTITLGGTVYSGEYVLQNSGGFVGIGSAFSGSAVASGAVYGASTNGNGKAYLTAPDGRSLSCDFSYSSMSASGIGVCRASDGKTYNMMIR